MLTDVMGIANTALGFYVFGKLSERKRTKHVKLYPLLVVCVIGTIVLDFLHFVIKVDF